MKDTKVREQFKHYLFMFNELKEVTPQEKVLVEYNGEMTTLRLSEDTAIQYMYSTLGGDCQNHCITVYHLGKWWDVEYSRDVYNDWDNNKLVFTEELTSRCTRGRADIKEFELLLDLISSYYN